MTEIQIVVLDAVDARAITDRIKTGVDAIWELIKQAYIERAWDALGYSSWDDYCTREFGSSRLRLPREERAEVVSSLRESGLSIRAIASATGTGTRQVQEAIAEAQVCSQTTPDDVYYDELAEELIATQPPIIIGTDGKTYNPTPRPQPKPVWSEEERATAERMAGKQESFNQWSRAVDGLTAALSYAKAFTPPDDLPHNYVSVAEFKKRYDSLGAVINQWNGETR